MKKNPTGKICAAVLGIAVMGMAALSQEKKEAMEAPKITHFGDLKWTPIIKGCDLASVAGDINVEGAPFVLRLRCADGTKIPAHWHPTDENVTVLKGTFLFGMGDTFDESKLQTMNVGNFVSMPKEMRHYAMKQRRDDRAGSRDGAVQSELGESIGGATPGCPSGKGEAVSKLRTIPQTRG